MRFDFLKKVRKKPREKKPTGTNTTPGLYLVTKVFQINSPGNRQSILSGTKSSTLPRILWNCYCFDIQTILSENYREITDCFSFWERGNDFGKENFQYFFVVVMIVWWTIFLLFTECINFHIFTENAVMSRENAVMERENAVIGFSYIEKLPLSP